MAVGLKNKLESHDRAGKKFAGTGRNGEEKRENHISSERAVACRATPTQRVFGFCGWSGCFQQVQCAPRAKLQFLLSACAIRETPFFAAKQQGAEQQTNGSHSVYAEESGFCLK